MKTLNPTRSFEIQLEINAPVDAVWKALTTAEELQRWFPLNAKVTPGPGGTIMTSWGAPWDGEAKIEIWEPNHHLKTGWPYSMASKEDPQPVPVSVDYHLESKGGKTTLRLVHSGFGHGNTWDHEFDGVSRGWAFELRGLRHYLENHAGQNRRVAWVRKPVTGSPSTIMPNVIGPKGRAFRGELAGLREGDPFRLEVVGANLSLEGKVAVNTPPRAFAGTVDSLNNGFMRVEMENCAGEEQIWAWISTYGIPVERVAEVQKTLEAAMNNA